MYLEESEVWAAGDVKQDSLGAIDRDVEERIGNGLSCCFLGDLGHNLNEEQKSEIGHVDILWVPVGGSFTIDAKTACMVVDGISPKVVIPMHYRSGGLTLPIAPLDDFLSLVDDEVVIRVGNEIEFEKDDLPPETEVWIFSP